MEEFTDWIPWHGSSDDSPPSALDPDDFIRVKLRRGGSISARVNELTWAISGNGGDILWYFFNPYQEK